MDFFFTTIIVGLTTMGLICIAAIIVEIVEMVDNWKK
jgi:hypothetical protein